MGKKKNWDMWEPLIILRPGDKILLDVKITIERTKRVVSLPRDNDKRLTAELLQTALSTQTDFTFKANDCTLRAKRAISC